MPRCSPSSPRKHFLTQARRQRNQAIRLHTGCRVFGKLDATGTGYVDLEEFYRFFKVERSPFGDRVFAVLDVDGSGKIDFREFALSIWNVCSMDMRSLLQFSFTLFDTGGQGRITFA